MTGLRHPELATEVFEANTYCPACGRYGPHAMRRPRPAPTVADRKAWEARKAHAIERNGAERTAVRGFDGRVVKTIERIPGFDEPEPTDREARFATIRVCECGKEWGQV